MEVRHRLPPNAMVPTRPLASDSSAESVRELANGSLSEEKDMAPSQDSADRARLEREGAREALVSPPGAGASPQLPPEAPVLKCRSNESEADHTTKLKAELLQDEPPEVLPPDHHAGGLLIPKNSRRLESDELVNRGDYVEGERGQLELWDGPNGFRAGSFARAVFRPKAIHPAGPKKRTR